MFKLALRRIHLFLALVAGFFLISLSISGALLIYAKDIQALVNPQYWRVDPSSQQQPLPLSALLNRIQQQSDEKIHLIERSENPDEVWQVRLVNKAYLNLNPYTGEVLLKHNFYDTFYGFVMAWHRWLIFRDDQGNRPMQLWMSIASLLLMIELVIGIILWLKPKHRLKRLKVRWQAKNKVRFHQLHLCLGAFCCIPLVLIAFSGMAFYWQDACKSIIEAVTLDTIVKRPKPPVLVKHASSANNAITIPAQQLDRAYQQAYAALASGQVYRIYMPQKDNEPLALRIKMPEETHGYSWSWADPYSGEQLAHFDASQLSIASQVWHFKYKFHIGDFIAWPVSLLWLFFSLLPCFFVASGLYLYWQRKV
ncbi:PepSY-associated TM helix domain-containing protein [Litorilituus sediminis]|uniref:PepSY domain-containing protein n=1 Tax=Litorilituus sediminis TaxID=718192 RepID=A0A4P6P4A9_9GAMM|nr:PepSY-associated TM helix domain-containing protein [Litorilituus sediminis]QBG36476.1 PepSY domain-containing protein [Litorilituus sediminis]